MEKYYSFSKEIIENVGGKGNIISLTHCVTRLRFSLKDEKQANIDHLKNMDGVITVMQSSGQFMVVVGDKVKDVYAQINKQLDLNTDITETEVTKLTGKSWFGQGLSILTSGMMPALGILCAGGIIKGLSTVLVLAGVWSMDSGPYQLIAAIADAAFYFLPVIIGYNLAAKLKMTPLLGLVMGAAICYPAINGVDLSLFGYVLNASYKSSFLPIVVMICVAAPFEKFLNKHIPVVVRGFMVPMIILLTIVPIGFVLIGPFVTEVGNFVNNGINSLLIVSPLLVGTLVAGFWQVFVLLGFHTVLLILPMTDVMAGNPNQFLTFTASASFAQIGVVLAIYFRTKDVHLKRIAMPAFVSGVFGITEPAIYGVTMPRIKMFVISCVGAAIGGTIAAVSGVMQYTIAGTGLIGLLGFLSPSNPTILPIILMTIVPFIFSFILAYFTYHEKQNTVDKEELEFVSEQSDAHSNNVASLYAPMSGKVIPLSESTDAAFSTGALGSGVVILPQEGEVLAPFNGVVSALFPSKHAIGLTSDEGLESLIHIGMDTVKLNGEGFTVHVKQGDRVHQGQKILSFDMDLIKSKGFSLETPVIVTNMDNYLEVSEIKQGRVNVGDKLIVTLKEVH